MPNCIHLLPGSKRGSNERKNYACAHLFIMRVEPRIGALCDGCDLFEIRARPHGMMGHRRRMTWAKDKLVNVDRLFPCRDIEDL